MSTESSALQLFVRRLAWRSVLTADEQAAILSLNGKIVEVKSHRDFVRLGEYVDHSCLVVGGVVGRFGQNSDGERQITCIHVPGDMADLPSVVSPKSGWGLTALTPATVLRLAHTDLRRIAAQHAGIAEAFWRDCVADGSMFSEWVVNVGRRDAITRIAHIFCEMAIRCERAGLGDRHSFPMAITQSDLADATGLTPVHVNRTLKELRNRAIVTTKAGQIVVHDWKAMVAVGDFDEGYMLIDEPCERILAPR